MRCARPIRVNGGLGQIHSAYRREFCIVDLLCVKAKVKKALTTYALRAPYPGEWWLRPYSFSLS